MTLNNNMGLRGSLPQLETIAPEPLTDLSPPEWLSGRASEFWLRHCDHLSANNLLNQETADSFALCCSLWARIHDNEGSSRTYLDTVKAYSSLAKVFRLLPTEKGGKPVQRHDSKAEFDF